MPDPVGGAEHVPAQDDLLLSVLMSSDDLTLVVTSEGMITFAAGDASDRIGISPPDLLGQDLSTVTHFGDVDHLHESIGAALRDDSASRVSVRLMVSDVPVPVDVAIHSLGGVADSGSVVMNIRRVASLSNPLDPYATAQTSFQQAFQRSPIGMALTTVDGNYVMVNQAMCDQLRTTEAALLNSSVLTTTHPDDLRRTVDSAVALLEGVTVSFSIEKRFLTPDGEPVWTRATTTILRAEDGTPLHFLTQVENIEERRQLIEQLRLSALRDPLTGLANRAGLGEFLESLGSEETIGVIALDLDRFKVVNDTLGHAVGDEVLRVVADRIRSSIRAEDHAARTGGDEFVVICAGESSEDDFSAIAQRCVASIRDVIGVSGEWVAVGASAGLVVGSACDATDILNRADRVSYKAKRDGRDLLVDDQVSDGETTGVER